jgi:peroxiredoxin
MIPSDESLNEKLAALSRELRAQYPAYAVVMDQILARTRDAGSAAPKPGEPMPPFMLPDERGRLTSLEETLANGPAAISFHRGHWCPFCRLNMIALAKAHREVAAVNGHLLAITPERWRFAAQLKRETGADFPVLTDMDNSYALSLNIAIWLGEDMGPYLAKAGFDLAAYQGSKSWLLPIPATFVVGTDGAIVARFLDPDYRKRMAIEELIAALTRAR